MLQQEERHVDQINLRCVSTLGVLSAAPTAVSNDAWGPDAHRFALGTGSLSHAAERTIETCTGNREKGGLELSATTHDVAVCFDK